MDAVWQKIKADIASRRLISSLIVVTIVAASALLTLALATLLNMEAPYDRSFEELNAAHLWLYFDRDKIRARDVERIEALPGVVESTGLQHSIVSRVRIRDTHVWVSLRLTPLQPPAVNRLFVQDGRYLSYQPGEILASRDLQELYGLQTGDAIGVTRWDGKRVDLPVTGLAYNPMWDTYRNTQPPYLYVSEETMRELFPDESSWDWSLGVRLADPESVDGVLAHVKATLRPDAIENHSDWRDVKSSAVFGAELNLIFLGAFSFFAILATILLITTSISAIVLSQFKQIGLLKAVGFTQAQILALYTGQYLILGLIGSPLGLLLGIVLSPLPLKSVASSLSSSFRPPFNAAIVALVLGIVSATIILSTLGSAYRGARANIVRAIAVGAEPPRKKPFFVVTLAARLGLPATFVLGLNDVFAKPFRSFLTGLSLTSGVIGIVFGLTLNETLDAYRADPSMMGIVYDAMVTRQFTSDSRTRSILSQAPGVEAFYGQLMVDVETLDGRSFQVKAVEGDLAAFPFRVHVGRFFEAGTREAIAGRGLLDWLGLRVGDEISLVLEGERSRPLTWRIVGQYPEPVNAGQMLMVSLSSVTPVTRDKPYSYYLKLAPQADTARLKHYLEPSSESDLNLALVGEALPSVVVYLQLAVFALAGILIGIAMVGVFNTSLLAVQEKLRGIGVLKTLGMTPAQVVIMITVAAAFLGLVAAAAGIPAGLLLTGSLLAGLSSSYGFGQVHVSLGTMYILLLPPLMVGISVLGSLIPARQAARLSIVSVLQNE
ncbi:MAG: FtsX-like permease family protein [Thermoflexales bacterium]|nr:FtsX-like permease family protein [Thermoflexales bacterium]